MTTAPFQVPCPNPSCTGLVSPSHRICLACRSRLKACPNCNAVMLADSGVCVNCLYGLEAETPISVTEQESAREATGADQSFAPYGLKAETPISVTEQEAEITLPQIKVSAEQSISKPVLVRFEQSQAEITEAIANAYHAVVSADANMRVATNSLETLREALLGGIDAIEIWKTIDDEIGRVETKQLQTVLIELRQWFEQCVTSRLIERLHRSAAQDLETGLQEWLQTYAEALAYWLLSLCQAMVEEPFPFLDRANSTLDLDFKQATKYVLHQRWAEAYPLFLSLAEQSSLHPVTRARLFAPAGQIQLYHYRNFDEALGLFRRAEALAPVESSVICGLGLYWLEKNDLERARAYFRRAIEVAPAEESGYVYMGDASQKEGHFAAAESWFQAAIREASGFDTGYTRLLRLYGRPQFIDTHESSIVPLAERAIAVNPAGKYAIYLEVGYAYQQSGRHYEEAHRWFQKAIDLDKEQVNAYNYQGNAYLEQSKYDEARAAFAQAIAVAPEVFESYLNMALIDEAQERWADALQWYEESQSRRPEWEGIIRAKMGEMLWKQQRYQAAESELFRALRAEPDNERALGLLHSLANDLYTKQDTVYDALRIYAEIRRLRGEAYEASYQNHVGNVKYHYDEYEEAVNAYRNAIAADPSVAVYHSNLAGAYREQKDWSQARDEFEIAYSLDKDENNYRRNLSRLFNAEGNEYYSKGDYHNAIERYERAIELQPDDAVLHSNLAGAWENLKVPGERLIALDNAISSLQKACELNPQDTKYAEKLNLQLERKRLALHFGERSLDMLLVVTPIALEVASDLIPYIEGSGEGSLSEELSMHVNAMRERILKEFGVKLPGTRFRGNETDLPNGTYIIMLSEIPIVSGTISLDKKLFPNSIVELLLLGVLGEVTTNPLTGDDACWIMKEDWEAVENAGKDLWDVIEYPIRHLESVVQDNLSEFIGHQEVANLLEAMPSEALSKMQDRPDDLSALTKVLKGLLDEKVPIVKLEEIVKRFCQLRETGTPLWAIGEEIRSIPGVRPVLPGNNSRYSFYRLGPQYEAKINHSMMREDQQPILVMEPVDCGEALTAVRNEIGSQRYRALIVEDPDLRPFLSELIKLEFPHIPVLSRQELLPELEDRIVGEVEL